MGVAGVLGKERSVWTTAMGKGFVKKVELALFTTKKIGLEKEGMKSTEDF